jgi:hypothetical protein
MNPATVLIKTCIHRSETSAVGRNQALHQNSNHFEQHKIIPGEGSCATNNTPLGPEFFPGALQPFPVSLQLLPFPPEDLIHLRISIDCLVRFQIANATCFTSLLVAIFAICLKFDVIS